MSGTGHQIFIIWTPSLWILSRHCIRAIQNGNRSAGSHLYIWNTRRITQFLFFYLMSPHGNLTSLAKQLCLYVHGYICTGAVYVYFSKNICEDLTASKNIYTFLELDIFYSVCHLSFKSFFPLQKTYVVLRKRHVHQWWSASWRATGLGATQLFSIIRSRWEVVRWFL